MLPQSESHWNWTNFLWPFLGSKSLTLPGLWFSFPQTSIWANANKRTLIPYIYPILSEDKFPVLPLLLLLLTLIGEITAHVLAHFLSQGITYEEQHHTVFFISDVEIHAIVRAVHCWRYHFSFTYSLTILRFSWFRPKRPTFHFSSDILDNSIPIVFLS